MTYMSSPSCQVARISNKRWRKQVSFSEDPVTEIPEDILETYQAEYYDSCVTGFVYGNRQVRAARTLQSIEETKAVELSRIQQEKEEQMAAALSEFQNEILDQEQDEPPPVIITDRVEEVLSSCEEISSLLDQFLEELGSQVAWHTNEMKVLERDTALVAQQNKKLVSCMDRVSRFLDQDSKEANAESPKAQRAHLSSKSRLSRVPIYAPLVFLST